MVYDDRWELSHGRVGSNAPSWLTFEVHRPYFDGGETSLTAIQAKGAAHAARLFDAADLDTPRFGMIMPASFRSLLTEESRLHDYRVARPTELPVELATPSWIRLSDAYRDHAALDDVRRAALASWLLAAALTDAVLELVPEDRPAPGLTDPAAAFLQFYRAQALFARDGLTTQARAAFGVLVDAPAATPAHLSALGNWSYLLARHAEDASQADRYRGEAWRLLDRVDLPGFRRGVWEARSLVRDATVAERAGDLDGAWALLEQSAKLADDLRPVTDAEQLVTLEMRRRRLDRQVEIAVKRGDAAAELAAITAAVEIDPTCVKARMQQAQRAERDGDLDAGLAGYLQAARLGPFGTAYALLRAASCAGRLGRSEFARGLSERAFRSAPRSEQVRDALVAACEATDDPTSADIVRQPRDGYRGAWHYRMYGGYFDLSESLSPCLYAGIPNLVFDFAVAGEAPRVGLQRILPPAFRTNLVHESGLTEFDVDDPRALPATLHTPRWTQLCDWVDGWTGLGPDQQYAVFRVLYRLGFHRLALDLLPFREAAALREPVEFRTQWQRAVAAYAAGQGRRKTPPDNAFALVDNPDCPLLLRFMIGTFGVVYAARETKSLADAERWRAGAQDALDALLASPDYTEFEKTMLHSRFYRGVGFVPFMRGERDTTVAEMAKAEELARAVPAGSEWEELVKRENLHACLESRSKEAFGLGEIELGHRRTEEFLALDPYDPKSHIELGECLAKQERYAEAADSYSRAARLGPIGTALAFSMAGEFYERAGLGALAEDCFVQALRVDPYAISGARGWRRTAAGSASDAVAAEYADTLEAWGAARKAAAR